MSAYDRDPEDPLEVFRRRDAGSPAVELAAAVMARALMDLSITQSRLHMRSGLHAHRIRKQAKAWLYCEAPFDDPSWPYYFPTLCDVLGLDADAVRLAYDQGKIAVDALTYSRTVPNPGGDHVSTYMLGRRRQGPTRWAS
jgi:hypothetical protein